MQRALTTSGAEHRFGRNLSFTMLIRISLILAILGGLAVAGIAGYLFLVLRSRYAADYRYFFDINALAEVSWRLESGELDGSGRFWTDEELAAGAATCGKVKPAKAKAAPAA